MLSASRPALFVDPCISLAATPPFGPGWVQEIKHDGYWLIVRRDGETVRLFTRRGHDWTDRYLAIAAAALKLRAKSFTVDGEAVVVGHDGVAVFDVCIAGTRQARRSCTLSTFWSRTGTRPLSDRKAAT